MYNILLFSHAFEVPEGMVNNADEIMSLHSDLLGRRHIADYEVERIGQVVAERCVRKAQDMVAAITRTLTGE